MRPSRLSFVKDPSVDDWIAPRLGSFGGQLSSFVPQSPSLIWPTDNSWCVATEVDFDSTLIAGDRHLIDAVLGAEDLEATPIQPGDSLDSRGDTVNV